MERRWKSLDEALGYYEDLEDAREGGDGTDVTDPYGASIHRAVEHDPPENTGHRYQRCGGGRRIIHKPIGG